jgi:membrane carboxypeptidase/penicillin-binding protein PbpC
MIKQFRNYMLKKALNKRLKRIGIMLKLEVDPKKKTIEFSILLVGEEAPLEASVKSYEILERDGKKFMKVGELETSKTWLNILLDEFVDGKEVELSEKTARLLNIVM